MLNVEIDQIGHESQKTTIAGRHMRWFALMWFALGSLSVVLPAVSAVAVEMLIAGILVVAGV